MPKLWKFSTNEMNLAPAQEHKLKLKRLENNLLYLNTFTLTKNFSMTKTERLTNVKVYKELNYLLYGQSGKQWRVGRSAK